MTSAPRAASAAPSVRARGRTARAAPARRRRASPSAGAFSRSVGSCSSRLTRSRAPARSTRSRSASRERLPARLVLAQHLLDDRVAALAQGRDRRHHVEARRASARSARPPRSTIARARRGLGLAHAEVARHLALEVVHVVQRDAGQVAHASGRCRAARRCRSAAAAGRRAPPSPVPAPRGRRSGAATPVELTTMSACDELRRAAPRSARRAPPKRCGQADRAVVAAVGDEHGLDAALVQRPRRQLAVLAGADHQHAARRRGRRACARASSTATRRHRHARAADRRSRCARACRRRARRGRAGSRSGR